MTPGENRQARAYRFGPLERRGVAGGLRLGQIVCLACAGAAAVISVRLLPNASGLPQPVPSILAGEFDNTKEDVPALRELYGVADEIEQNLAEPGWIAPHSAERIGGDQAKALWAGAGSADVHDCFDDFSQFEFTHLEFALSRFELGEVEYVVDQVEQRVAAVADYRQLTALIDGKVRTVQQLGHPDNAVERRADLVTHGREKRAFGAVAGFGGREAASGPPSPPTRRGEPAGR